MSWADTFKALEERERKAPWDLGQTKYQYRIRWARTNSTEVRYSSTYEALETALETLEYAKGDPKVEFAEVQRRAIGEWESDDHPGSNWKRRQK